MKLISKEQYIKTTFVLEHKGKEFEVIHFDDGSPMPEWEITDIDGNEVDSEMEAKLIIAARELL